MIIIHLFQSSDLASEMYAVWLNVPEIYSSRKSRVHVKMAGVFEKLVLVHCTTWIYMALCCWVTQIYLVALCAHEISIGVLHISNTSWNMKSKQNLIILISHFLSAV